MRRLLVGLGLVVIASSASAESLQYICEKTRMDTIKIHSAMEKLEETMGKASDPNISVSPKVRSDYEKLIKLLLGNTRIYHELSCYERGVK
mgnify:CR=1 FL=1